MNYCYAVPKDNIAAVERIIVIGDIHGDWKALIKSLRLGKVIDHHNKWIGGKTHVVQVGDLLDRKGRGSRASSDEKSEAKILKFLFRLQKSTHDQVHILLGNHELMNVMGNFKYVSAMGMEDFDGKRKSELAPGGKTSKKMACNTNSIIKIGSWIFSHAGVSSNLSSKYKISDINKKVREFLLGNTKLESDDEIMDAFWTREYSSNGNCGMLDSALTEYDSKYMVVGHSVQPTGINSKCNGSLWKVDVGMSDAFDHKRIQVLEIINDGQKINVLNN